MYTTPLKIRGSRFTPITSGNTSHSVCGMNSLNQSKFEELYNSNEVTQFFPIGDSSI